ncbi:MAG: Hsp70 family protein, partial [Deltaproteobacteria bacterium]|nr:Hsp70 family protein [Deltaproteobacteria bacterium]
CELSVEGVKTTQIEIPSLIKDEEGRVHNIEMELTRDQFNEAIRPLIVQSKDAVQRALDSAKLTVEDISRIILVGGSTKVPLVREMLTELLGKEPYGDANPDTIVARGAAVYGAQLSVPTEDVEPEKPQGSIVVTNIVTHHLGIETFGGKFTRLLDKDSPIPAEAPLAKQKEFTTPRDDMTELRIAVYQSDREASLVRDEGVHYVGEFELRGLPAKPRGVVKIDVSFSIDQQNLLKVSARRRRLPEETDEPKEEVLEIQR